MSAEVSSRKKGAVVVDPASAKSDVESCTTSPTSRISPSEVNGATSRNGGPVSTTELAISVTKCKKLDNENNDLQTQKPDLGKTWVKVNEVTWKLTDGEMSRTSASHGQWGGYNTERGLAWIMDIGWVAGCASWYARCGDKSYGTASFADAKAAARAFVTGAALEKDELAFAGAVDLNAAAVKALESQAPQTMKAGSTGREKVVVSNNVKTTE